jgi:hypothetical protein
MSAGAPMSIELRGGDLDTLRAAARSMREELARHAGVIDISDSFRGGKQEVELEIPFPWSGESIRWVDGMRGAAAGSGSRWWLPCLFQLPSVPPPFHLG